ncbi:hypothetical protein [Rhizobium sp. 9140]|uniref:hypothetical protein n=1 Tax=Rhizobium sp. 9140 TaxID=1761900 RepID=UPI00079C097D|nr:hypothetical protein [Rhizobium sp. 9140]CZT36126.1 hypothetical protein GA0004734_00031280 [Rhizobium sp. 9140]
MTITQSAALTLVSCNPELRNFVASGGRTGTGRQQNVFRDAGFWEIGVAFRTNNKASVLAYRAMIARLRQGEDILVSLVDLYCLEGEAPSKILAPAARRATTVQVEGVAADLEPGHHITIQNRLHRVTEVLAQTETIIGTVLGAHDGSTWADGSTWVDEGDFTSSIKFLPPLRAAIAANTLVEFDDLKCLCVLKDMGDGDLDLDLGRFGSPSLTFIETI